MGEVIISRMARFANNCYFSMNRHVFCILDKIFYVMALIRRSFAGGCCLSKAEMIPMWYVSVCYHIPHANSSHSLCIGQLWQHEIEHSCTYEPEWSLEHALVVHHTVNDIGMSVSGQVGIDLLIVKNPPTLSGRFCCATAHIWLDWITDTVYTRSMMECTKFKFGYAFCCRPTGL